MSIGHISSMIFFAAVGVIAILSLVDSFRQLMPSEAPRPNLKRVWHIAILVAGLGWLVTMAWIIRNAA